MSSPSDDAARDPALGLLRVLRDDGRTDPATDPFLEPETLLAIYREMRKARALDEAMVLLQQQGRIGFHNSCAGQEAVPIGAAFALERSDWVFPAFRESVLMLMRGFPLERYLAQAFGSSKDVLKGRQMPGHMSAREVNVVSWSTSVATQLPQAVGTAWATKKAGARAVVAAFVGEGGTSSPDFHAAMNFAGVFRVPCIIVCQNNQWAISTPASRQTASATFAVKAKAYGVPGVRIDGNDVLAVHRAVTDARVRAVAGGGPTLIECVTYRMGPQPAGDTLLGEGGDAARDEWTAKDPLERFLKHLGYLQLHDSSADAALRQELQEEIRAAIAHAEKESPPDPSTLFDDVYAELPLHLVEQAEAFRAGRAV
jgi:pyruvate dehydrogenase E1 component alpha subunit